MVMEHWRKVSDREEPKYSEQKLPKCHSVRNPTWIGLGLNQSICK